MNCEELKKSNYLSVFHVSRKTFIPSCFSKRSKIISIVILYLKAQVQRHRWLGEY
jgi:hypothetical protein